MLSLSLPVAGPLDSFVHHSAINLRRRAVGCEAVLLFRRGLGVAGVDNACIKCRILSGESDSWGWPCSSRARRPNFHIFRGRRGAGVSTFLPVRAHRTSRRRVGQLLRLLLHRFVARRRRRLRERGVRYRARGLLIENRGMMRGDGVVPA